MSKEVASVLERAPLTIHPRRKVAIDEELPASPFLPSPLTPQASTFKKKFYLLYFHKLGKKDMISLP